MNIRYSENQKDKKQGKDIWKKVFTDSKEYVDFYFEKRYSKEKFLLIEDKKDFLGGLHENPYNFSFYGNLEKTRYLVAVAVLPEKRNKGVFNSLILHSLKKMKIRGERESFLVPSNPMIYEKYGFQYSHFLERYSFSFDAVKEFKMEYEVLETHSSSEDISKLTDFYNKSMEKFSSSILKTEKDIVWDLEELNFEEGYSYCVKEKKEIVGFFSYNILEDKIQIKNILYRDLKVLKTIFSFFKSFKEYYKGIEVTAFCGSALERVFNNKKEIKKEIYPFVMTRILDPERAIKEFLSYEKTKINFVLDLEDTVLLENSRKYFIGENSSEKSLTLKLEIGTLVELLYGVYTLEELLENEKILMKNVDETLKEIKKIFIKRKNYIEQYV